MEGLWTALPQWLSQDKKGLSAGTGKLCIFGHLGLVFIWSCFVSCLLLLLYYVICAPVLTEGTNKNLTAMTYKSRQVTGDLPLSLGRKGNLIFGTKLYAEHTVFRALGPLQFFLQKQASMLTIQYACILATCKNASLEREIQS